VTSLLWNLGLQSQYYQVEVREVVVAIVLVEYQVQAQEVVVAIVLVE
jgi:hypothetical protein